MAVGVVQLAAELSEGSGRIFLAASMQFSTSLAAQTFNINYTLLQFTSNNLYLVETAVLSVLLVQTDSLLHSVSQT